MSNYSEKKFIEFINVITAKPGMFLVNNIEDIGLVIFGYQNGCFCNSDYYQSLNEMLQKFRSFINEEFENAEDFDYVRLIRFHAVSDKTSIDLFKIKFKKFVSVCYPFIT